MLASVFPRAIALTSLGYSHVVAWRIFVMRRFLLGNILYFCDYTKGGKAYTAAAMEDLQSRSTMTQEQVQSPKSYRII